MSYQIPDCPENAPCRGPSYRESSNQQSPINTARVPQRPTILPDNYTRPPCPADVYSQTPNFSRPRAAARFPQSRTAPPRPPVSRIQQARPTSVRAPTTRPTQMRVARVPQPPQQRMRTQPVAYSVPGPSRARPTICRCNASQGKNS